MPSSPTTTDEVTREHLTDALRLGGVIGNDTAVAEVDHHPIGEGVGIVGQLARLTLRYEGTAEGAPSSVVVKMPSQYPENRAVGEHFNFYEREARFYQQIGDKSPLRTPRCFHNHLDVDRREFLLLLEDLGDRTLISQIAGMDAARAGVALDALARLHAEWWDSPALDSLTWLPRLVDPVNLSAGEQYRQSWPAYLERFGDQLPDGAVAIGERVKDVWEQLVVDTDARWPGRCRDGPSPQPSSSTPPTSCPDPFPARRSTAGGRSTRQERDFGWFCWRFWMLAHSSRRPTVRCSVRGSSGSAAK
jgi:hypothetical protein